MKEPVGARFVAGYCRRRRCGSPYVVAVDTDHGRQAASGYCRRHCAVVDRKGSGGPRQRRAQRAAASAAQGVTRTGDRCAASGKVAYLTLAEAQERLARSHGGRGHCHPCEHCRNWHLTGQKKPGRRRRWERPQ